MIELLYLAIAVLALINVIVVVNVAGAPVLREHSSPSSSPLVSVLIPARNEERNLADCLSAFEAQSYRNIRILVLDDQSSDSTYAIAEAFAARDSRFKVVRGLTLPEGWTGKNWACAQLAAQATGEILLFVDADVRAAVRAVENTVATLERYQAHAVSSFPKQELKGLAARAVIPMMDVILFGALPLPLVWRVKYPSLSAGNGQWFAFRRDAYTKIGTHDAVRSDIVEDVALARLVKRSGLRMVLASGVGSVTCVMYSRLSEVIEGFSKNFFAAFRFRISAFLPVLALIALAFVLPFVLLLHDISAPVLLAVALNVTFRTLLAARLHHGVLSVLLHPIGSLAAVLIGLNAIRVYYVRGGVRWKSRTILVKPKRPTARSADSP